MQTRALAVRNGVTSFVTTTSTILLGMEIKYEVLQAVVDAIQCLSNLDALTQK